MDATKIEPLRAENLPAGALAPLSQELDPAITPKQRELAESVFIGLLNAPAAKACSARLLAQSAIVVLVQLGHDLGGFSYYFTRMGNLRAAALRRAIHAEFSGSNHMQLARKHGITETRVRQLLEEKP